MNRQSRKPPSGKSHVRRGLIVLTDETCAIGGRSWPGIPTLVWPEGIDVAASDWARQRVLDGVTPQSAQEDLKCVRPFLSFCRVQKRAWDEVDDDFLIRWRTDLGRRGVGAQRQGRCLDAIFSFYNYCEHRGGHLSYVVGSYDPADLPEDMRGVRRFPIGARRVLPGDKHMSRAAAVNGGWVGIVKAPQGRRAARATPTEAQLLAIHDALAADRARDRNGLLMWWPEKVGTRRAETLQLRVSDFFRRQQGAMRRDWTASDTLSAGHPLECTIFRKGAESRGGEPDVVFVDDKDLVLATIDYIKGERQDVVNSCKRRNPDYVEPEEVFISTTTGKALAPDSYTAIGRRLFDKAGLSKANIHRLRAFYITTEVEAAIDRHQSHWTSGATMEAYAQTVLVDVAARVGQRSWRSLEPYLGFCLLRHERDNGDLRHRHDRIRSAKLLPPTGPGQVSQVDALLAEVSLQADAADPAAVAAKMRQAADRIEQAIQADRSGR